jgi:hypothetical protein
MSAGLLIGLLACQASGPGASGACELDSGGTWDSERPRDTDAAPQGVDTGGRDSGERGDSGADDGDRGEGSDYDDSYGGNGGDEDALEVWGEAVVTIYTFQDNSACSSTMTASGRPLVPYVSVALPFRYLADYGGPFSLGDALHVSFLEGRIMPDGSPHSGWVRIDDFCGDGGDDSYCLQGGLPNVDLYVGDWAESGMSCEAADLEEWGTGAFSGPGGDGQEPAVVALGPAPAGEPAEGYGGAAMGEGDCGDCDFARTVQPPACWHYDPGEENIEYCDCSNSNGRSGECEQAP